MSEPQVPRSTPWRRTRAAATTALWLLPPSRAKNALLQRIGHRVAADARLGLSLVLGCDRFEILPGAAIGHGNIFRNLRSVRIGERCSVGQLNQFTAIRPFQPQFRGAGILWMESEADITSRHSIDCSGTVRLEHRSMIGGVRSLVRSCEFDLAEGRWSLGTVVIGSYSMVGAKSLLLKNAVVPPNSLVAAGAVVTSLSAQDQTPGLYAGSPVTWKRELPECAWWHREALSTMPASASDVDFDILLPPTGTVSG